MTALAEHKTHPGFPGFRAPERVEGGTGGSPSPFSNLTIPDQSADARSQQPASRPASEELSGGPTDHSQAQHPQQTVSSVSGGASILELRRSTTDELAEQHGFRPGTPLDRVILEVKLRETCAEVIATLDEELGGLTNVYRKEVFLGSASIDVEALQRSLPALSLESLHLRFIRVAALVKYPPFFQLTPPSTSPAIQELKEALEARGCSLSCQFVCETGHQQLNLTAKVKEC